MKAGKLRMLSIENTGKSVMAPMNYLIYSLTCVPDETICELLMIKLSEAEKLLSILSDFQVADKIFTSDLHTAFSSRLTYIVIYPAQL